MTVGEQIEKKQPNIYNFLIDCFDLQKITSFQELQIHDYMLSSYQQPNMLLSGKIPCRKRKTFLA
jgi:hypothetical protein